MKILLEVIAQWKINEGVPAAVRSCRWSAALDDGQVACGEMTIEVRNEGCHLDPAGAFNEFDRCEDPRHDHAQFRIFVLAIGHA